MNRIAKFLLILFALNGSGTFAQKAKLDSLSRILRTAKQDTSYVNTLNEYSKELRNIDPDTAIIIGEQAFLLSTKLKWMKGQAGSQLRLGVSYYNAAQYDKAEKCYKTTLIICEKMILSPDTADQITGKRMKGRALGNLALICYTRSDYPNGLDYNLQSMKIAEELGDKQQVANILSNIGGLYASQTKHDKALDYYLKSIKIYIELGDKIALARIYTNVGNVYTTIKEEAKALDYFDKSLKLAEETGNKRGVARTLGNLGGIYMKRSEHAKAIVYFKQALSISEEVGDKLNAGANYGNLGRSLMGLGQYKEAEKNIKLSLKIAEEINNKESVLDQFYCLYELYEITGQNDLALRYYKKQVALKDSIFNIENSKRIMRSEIDHEYEKKKAVADAKHDLEMKKQQLLDDEKSRRQMIIIALVGAGLILVMIFAGFIFRSLRVTKKQRDLIEKQKHEVDAQRHIVEKQKDLVEEKQKEIIGSIHYAKRIQHALLPSENYIHKKLNELNN